MRHFNRCCGKQIILSLIFTLCCASSVNLAQASKSNSNVVAAVNFQEVPLKQVIKTLTSQLKWNVVFDETFRDEPKYDLELKDVTLEAALKIVLIQKRLMARIIEDRTIIIFHDHPTNRGRFEEFPAWPAK